MEVLIYGILGLSSFFFVVVPVSGSFFINPLLTLVTEPHVAVSIAAFFFLLNSTIKALVFRKNILVKYIRGILPISLLGSALGAFLVSYIPSKLLLFLVLGFSIYFLGKTARNVFLNKSKTQNANFALLSTMSLLSGFMQGTGLGSGGGLRKQYLLSEKITLSEMNGTTSFISAWVMLISVFVRLTTDQVALAQLMPVIYLIPLMIIATILGRTVLKRMDKKMADIVILITMTLITLTLAHKIFI